MARSISLSDEAFATVRSEKREGESDSDVVLRLAREARKKRKDPMKFLEWCRSQPARDWGAYEAWLEKMRQADIEKAERLWRERQAGT